MNITQKGIATGVILIALALTGYLGSGMESWTALIPTFAGVPIPVGSLIARDPAKQKHGMHLAALFGLLGFLAPLGRIIPTVAKGEFVLNLATGCMIAMTVASAIFVFFCVQSFKEARRNRES